MKAVFENLRPYDRACAEKYKMPGEILMENAARGLYEYIKVYVKKHFKTKPILAILCGSGDNGADGLALARMISDLVNVHVVQLAEPKSELCILQSERLKLLGFKVQNEIGDCDILLDAFLGTGFRGDLRENAVTIIKQINALKAFKIACDVPSGINEKGLPSPIAVKADVTLSAGALKLCLYSDAAKDYVGKIKTITLGLASEKYAKNEDAFAFLLEKNDMKLPFRKLKNCHKGMFGHACIYAGEKEGAAILAGLACLKFGAGLVTLCGNKPTFVPPDLMYVSKANKDFSAYCLGPGLADKAEDYVNSFLLHTSGKNKQNNTINTNVVFDADALKTKSLAENLSRFTNCIISPHPKEFVELLKNVYITKSFTPDSIKGLKSIEDISPSFVQENRFTFAKIFSKSFPNIALVLKGANTIISYGEKMYISTAGSASLAKAGSGDVLAGMLTALLAQGYNILDACITACLAHGFASQSLCSYGSTASDLISKI